MRNLYLLITASLTSLSAYFDITTNIGGSDSILYFFAGFISGACYLKGLQLNKGAES